MKGCRKEKDRENERKREISKTGLRLNCLPQAQQKYSFWKNVSFLHIHTLSFGNEETKRGVRLLLENFIRIEKKTFFPLRKDPPHHHHLIGTRKKKERKNDLI